MKRNLQIKFAVIAATILICLYGIVGLPTSLAQLKANAASNIHLGLDLRGGTHLVLQVQLQDAFMAAADVAMDRMKEEMKKDGINYAALDRNELASLNDAGKIQINVNGVPPANTSVFRSLVTDQFPDWILTPVNPTDYRLNMKPSEAIKLKQDTLVQTMHTIERKINALGLAESSVQQRGRGDAEAELLVQLPGVDDPARVKAAPPDAGHARAV